MKTKNLLIISAASAGLIIIAWMAGKVNSSIRFRKRVKEMFSLSNIISDKVFTHEQVTGLPEPVERYFNYVLKEGQPYISYARITHDGQFKTDVDKDWVNIKGEQYATTEKPGFIWKGKTRAFEAEDSYIAGKGRLVVSMLSLVKVADGKGTAYDQGELLRWLGESVLYPTNLLPGNRLQWSPIDSMSATLEFNYRQLSLFYKVTFNNIGEIIELETKRYRDEKNLATWIIKLADYKAMNGIMVPKSFEVIWRLQKGDFSYARFIVKKIDYDIPKRF